VRYSAIKRYALICGFAAWATSASAQPAPAPGAHPPPGAPASEAARRRPRPTPPPSAVPTPNNPHGVKRQSPRILPANDLPAGDVEVRLHGKDTNSLANAQVTLLVSKQSIERGNTDTTLTAITDDRGVARFSGQGTESDYVYDVQVAIGAARYSSGQFQFRNPEGLRVLMPVYESQSELDGLLMLTRTLVALIPQDNLFVVDVLFRVENYGDVSWLPENIVFPLPEGFKALTVRDPKKDAHFEAAGDTGVKLVGTIAPGQHDLLFRFHLPTEGKSERSFRFPTNINTGMVRVILESSPTMKLEIPGFPAPEESRNQEGQRRLMTGRDFVTDKVRAPDDIEIKISGIPTPAAGRSVAVGLAAVIALGGIAQGISRRRSPTTPQRSDLSKEDRQRASELLLEELIGLEQAFQQGTIGRKTHEAAKRQLLEAFARLRSDPDADEA
jgi:hypothetical protein